MTLLAPGWLALLLLSPLIVALHARRRTTVRVSSVWLMRSLIGPGADPAPRLRIPLSLPLMLQLLVLAALALALARPVAAAEVVDHVVVVLEASAWLVDAEAFAAARRAAELEIRRAEAVGASVSLVLLRPLVEAAAVRVDDVQLALAALEGVDVAHGPGDLTAAVATVASVADPAEQTRVVWVVASGTAGALPALVGGDHRIVPIAVATPGPRFSGDLWPVAEDLGGGRWELSGSLAPTEGASVSVMLRFRPDGAQSDLELERFALPVSPVRPTPFTREVRLPGPGVLTLSLSDEDPYANAHFVLATPEPIAGVLHVGPPNAPLRRAIEANPGLAYVRSATLPSDADRYHWVVVDRTRVDRHPGTNTLWLGVAPPNGFAPLEDLEAPDPVGWFLAHPLSVGVEWNALAIYRAKELPRLPGATVLLGAVGSPLLQARTTGFGREVVTAFSMTESNWPELASFPTFVANLSRWSAVPERACRVGQVCDLEPRMLAPGSRLLDPKGRTVVVPSPYVAADSDNPAGNYLPQGTEVRFWPDYAGVYRLIEGERQRSFAVLPAPLGEPREANAAPPLVVTATPMSWRSAALGLALAALVLEGLVAYRSRGRQRSVQVPVALRRRRWRLRILRGATLLAVAVTFATISLAIPEQRRNFVLLLDSPDSYTGVARTLVGGFSDAIGRAVGAGSTIGAVALGAEPRVVGDLGGPIPATLAGDGGADYESALLLAAGLLASRDGRIVVAGDGVEGSGRIERAWWRLAARGVPVDVLPVGGIPNQEVLVEIVDAPARPFAGAEWLLEAVVLSEGSTLADLRVYRDGQVVAEQEVRLVSGRNRVEVPMSEPEPGFVRYEVEVLAPGDTFARNDRDGVYVRIQPSPRVALVSGQPQRAERLVSALALHAINVDVLAPSDVPASVVRVLGTGVGGWLDYDVAILMDVPAIDLTWAQQRALTSWVRDHGGGLLVLGGENTYGPGGYYLSLLEEALPLSTHVPHERPVVAIAFVLDRSSSMRASVGGSNRLDITKQATVEAIRLLNPESIVGIVVFDFAATEIGPLNQVGGNVQPWFDILSPLVPGGGTNIYAGLDLGYRSLTALGDDVRRHIVLMTDGLTQQVDNYEELTRGIAASGITVSTAAIGAGADVRLLARIAELGGGSAYATTDFQVLPSILTREALLLSDDPIRTGATEVAWDDDGTAFLQGLQTRWPPLDGFVMTTAKQGAAVHAAAGDGEPLLASWRFGLGQVAAFTSQAVGPWSANWNVWPEYPRLWAQMVRWAAAPTWPPGYHVVSERLGDGFELVVTAIADDGSPLRAPFLEGRLVGDSLERSLRFEPLGGGAYGAETGVLAPGSYDLFVGQQGRAAQDSPTHRLWIGYPARYSFDSVAGDTLVALAAATDGIVAVDVDYAHALPTPTWTARRVDLRTTFLLAAVTLLLLELMLRYLGRWPRATDFVWRPPQP